jgi:hypothetical protein
MTTQTISRRTSRLSPAESDTAASSRELLILVSAGVTAAAISTFVNLDLSIPGHAILKAVLPISFGLALAPRRYAGTIMGTSALLSGLLFRGLVPGNDGLGIGAFTSLIVFGPTLDVLHRSFKKHISEWWMLALAGLATNSIAFLVRGTFKWMGKDIGFNKLFSIWFSTAIVTYAVCGILAGLICGMIFFRYQSDSREST